MARRRHRLSRVAMYVAAAAAAATAASAAFLPLSKSPCKAPPRSRPHILEGTLSAAGAGSLLDVRSAHAEVDLILNSALSTVFDLPSIMRDPDLEQAALEAIDAAEAATDPLEYEILRAEADKAIEIAANAPNPLIEAIQEGDFGLASAIASDVVDDEWARLWIAIGDGYFPIQEMALFLFSAAFLANVAQLVWPVVEWMFKRQATDEEKEARNYQILRVEKRLKALSDGAGLLELPPERSLPQRAKSQVPEQKAAPEQGVGAKVAAEERTA